MRQHLTLNLHSTSSRHHRSHVPYITCDPEVQTHRIDADRDQFLLLVSDGLYELLSHAEMAACVFHHLVGGGDPFAVADVLLDYAVRHKVSCLRILCCRTIQMFGSEKNNNRCAVSADRVHADGAAADAPVPPATVSR